MSKEEKKILNRPWLMSFQALKALLLICALLHIVQYVKAAREKDSPLALGDIIQDIGFREIEATNSPLAPLMRAKIAIGNTAACDFWNFEGLWGRCARITIEVLDYSNANSSAILLRASGIASYLATPCSALDKSSDSLAAQRKQAIGCGTSVKPFRLVVRLVPAVRRPGPLYGEAQNPYFWNTDMIRNQDIFISKKGKI